MEGRHQHASSLAANAPDNFEFQAFTVTAISVGAVAETLQPETLTRVHYPDDSEPRTGAALRQEYFSLPLADLVRRFRRGTRWNALPEHRHPAQRYAPTLAVPS